MAKNLTECTKSNNKDVPTLPCIMIHGQIQNLIWVCSEQEDSDALISTIVYNDKFLEKEVDKSDLESIINDLKQSGWIKGYIPDINIKYQDKIVNTIKI